MTTITRPWGQVITLFSQEELIEVAEAMYNAQRVKTWESIKDLYNDLCYFLGAHYWGHEYAWNAKGANHD